MQERRGLGVVCNQNLGFHKWAWWKQEKKESGKCLKGSDYDNGPSYLKAKEESEDR